MSFVLPHLNNKQEIDTAIRETGKKVLVLRFGRDLDPVCQKLDDIVRLSARSSLTMPLVVKGTTCVEKSGGDLFGGSGCGANLCEVL